MSNLARERGHSLVVSPLPEYLEGNAHDIESASEAAYTRVKQAITAHECLDKPHFTSLEQNAAIATTTARKHVNLLHTGRQPSKGLIYFNPYLAATEKALALGVGKIRNL